MRTIAVAAVLVALAAGSAQATPGQCQRTIIREAALYNRKVMQTRQGCDNVNVGRSEPLLDCSEDGDLSFRYLGLEQRFAAQVSKECRNVDFASIGWSECPGFEGGQCAGGIANLADLVNCVVCLNTVAVDQVAALAYGALTPSPDPHLKACQKSIGAAAGPFFENKVKAMARCELRTLSGDIPGPCPEDPKTHQTIEELAAKSTSTICNKCGHGACGDGDDRSPSEIGFPPACPDVTIPNGVSCRDDSIDSLRELVACVNCVTEFKVDCLDALAAPGVKAYPSECR